MTMAFPFLSLFFSSLLSFSGGASASPLRRSLHHPLFFPLDSFPPSSSPYSQPQPKLPSSSTPLTQLPPFFPTSASSPPPPPPPPPPSSFLVTFPANISALLLPTSPSSSTTTSASSRRRLVAVLVSITLLAVALLFALSALILIHRRRRNAVAFSPDKSSHADGLRLVPPNTSSSSSSSDAVPSFSAGQPPHYASTSSSSEFLYLGTLSSTNPFVDVAREPAPGGVDSSTLAPGSYKKLGSPELRPLPPLPRVPTNLSGESTYFCNNNVGTRKEEDREDDGEDQFFSPRGSSSHRGSTGSPDLRPASNSRRESEFLSQFGSRSLNSGKASHPYTGAIHGYSRNSSSSSGGNVASLQMDSSSPEPILKFPAPTLVSVPRAILMNSPTLSSPQSDSETLKSKTCTPITPITRPARKLWLPPPPLSTPRRFWENPISQDPVAGTPDAWNAELQRTRSGGTGENTLGTPWQPKTEPLHWDHVGAGSDRAMVWDHVKSTSFQVHEEVIETLFTETSSTQDSVLLSVPPLLDAEKSQNIAVSLKSLTVRVDKVFESLMEGNVDSMEIELLESLLKVAPTKEEEQKLIEVNDESLGPAEKFLKELLDVPFVFKRVNAMLYIAKFEAETKHLRRSFETLKAACGELRNSKLFSKFLEVVLETGIRMNVGTSRGDDPAFKLDMLLNLVDIKGKDGRTSLLHSVMQETARIEGRELSDRKDRTNESSLKVDTASWEHGLQIMSGLTEELANVKKAATVDSSVLSDNVMKLADGIARVEDVLRLSHDEGKDNNRGLSKFTESMWKFVQKAREEIAFIQAEESTALLLAREVTEYFLGESSKEAAHPFRVFLIVKDFLATLDSVCEEVGRT